MVATSLPVGGVTDLWLLSKSHHGWPGLAPSVGPQYITKKLRTVENKQYLACMPTMMVATSLPVGGVTDLWLLSKSHHGWPGLAPSVGQI